MEAIKVCKSCLMPSSRPRVTFDNSGVCNACNYKKKKEKINWKDREKEFLEICDKHRSKNGKYDCI